MFGLESNEITGLHAYPIRRFGHLTLASTESNACVRISPVGTATLVDKLITHAFPMSQAQQAFELQLTGRYGKVVLHPWK